MKTFFTTLLLVLAGTSPAQNPNWIKILSGRDHDELHGTFRDNAGNTYVYGQAGRGSKLNNEPVDVMGRTDAFIAKLNPDNEVLWTVTLGDSDRTGDPYNRDISECVYDIMVAPDQSSLILTGGLSTNSQYQGCTLNTFQEGRPSDKGSRFVMAMDAEGNCQWSKIIVGEYSMALKPVIVGENLYLSFSVEEYRPATLLPDNIPLSRPGTYFIQYDLNGTAQSAPVLFENMELTGISAGDKLCLAGYYYKDIVVNGNSYAIGNRSRVACVMLTDPEGQISWFKAFESPAYSAILDIRRDGSGNLFILGIYKDEIIIGQDTLRYSGNSKFVAKLDYNGNFLWGKNLPFFSISETPAKMIVNEDGSIYLSGCFQGNATIGNYNLTAQGNRDMYYTHVTSDGEFLTMNTIPGASWNWSINRYDNELLITGGYDKEMTVGGNTYTNGTGLPWGDAFVLSIALPTGIDEVNGAGQLIIAANPSNGLCRITVPPHLQNQPDLVLKVYDLAGKLLEEVKVQNNSNLEYDLAQRARGTYQVVLESSAGSCSGRVVFQ